MNTVGQLLIDKDIVSWKDHEDCVSVRCESEIEQAFALRASGVAIIEKNERAKEAKIYNNDGTLRFILQNPFRAEEGYVFYYFNYENDKLIAVLAGSSRDFACYVDENSGNMSPPRETR